MLGVGTQALVQGCTSLLLTLCPTAGRHEAACCTCYLKPRLEADTQGSWARASVSIPQVTEDYRAPASEDTATLSAPGGTSPAQSSAPCR